MRSAIYIRCSTEGQEPDNQLSQVQEMCGKNVPVYKENASAWKIELGRPTFDKLLGKIHKGQIDHIYVWDLDRIYRNRLTLVRFIEACRANRCKIHSFRQQWLEDINNIPEPWNQIIYDFMCNIMGWMAEEESNKKSERVRAAMRIKKGKTISYKGNWWGRKPLPKQTRDRIIELHTKGESMRTIANEVVTWVNGNPKKISKSAVHKIISQNQLQNKGFTGRI